MLAILGCDTDHTTKVCSPPSTLKADESCFKLEMGLEVNAEEFQSAAQIMSFRWGYYPQQETGVIDLSPANEKYASIGGSRFIIPGKEMEGVSRFALKVEMRCNGQSVDLLNYVFDSKIERPACIVWVGTKL